MAFNFMWPLRGLQFLLAVVVLGLMAYVSNWWTSHWHQMSPAEINFIIFSPSWTILAIPVLVAGPMFFPLVANKSVVLAIEFFTMLYWLAGFIAMAVFLSDRICFGTVCSVAKAGTAIAAFEWIVFAGTFGVAVMGMRKNKVVGREYKGEMPEGV
jgi:hypothetical protein